VSIPTGRGLSAFDEPACFAMRSLASAEQDVQADKGLASSKPQVGQRARPRRRKRATPTTPAITRPKPARTQGQRRGGPAAERFAAVANADDDTLVDEPLVEDEGAPDDAPLTGGDPSHSGNLVAVRLSPKHALVFVVAALPLYCEPVVHCWNVSGRMDSLSYDRFAHAIATGEAPAGDSVLASVAGRVLRQWR